MIPQTSTPKAAKVSRHSRTNCGQRAAVVGKGQRGQNRQVTFRLNGQDGRTNLGQIHHGLNHKQIDTGCQLPADLLAKNIRHLGQGQFPGRIKESSGRTKVACDQNKTSGIFLQIVVTSLNTERSQPLIDLLDADR